MGGGDVINCSKWSKTWGGNQYNPSPIPRQIKSTLSPKSIYLDPHIYTINQEILYFDKSALTGLRSATCRRVIAINTVIWKSCKLVQNCQLKYFQCLIPSTEIRCNWCICTENWYIVIISAELASSIQISDIMLLDWIAQYWKCCNCNVNKFKLWIFQN